MADHDWWLTITDIVDDDTDNYYYLLIIAHSWACKELISKVARKAGLEWFMLGRAVVDGENVRVEAELIVRNRSLQLDVHPYLDSWRLVVDFVFPNSRPTIYHWLNN